MLSVLIGLVTVAIVGYAILKGKYPHLVLFAAGVFMLLVAVFFDMGDFLPKKAKPTGNSYLDIIEFIRYMFSFRLAGLGLLIMTMVGFANYMTFIGANDAFVKIAVKPMRYVKNPYVMIFMGFIVCKLISLVITSASGLGVLCLALLGPLLINFGVNPKAVGALAATSGAASLVLVGGSTVASAEASGMSVVDYVFNYKIAAGLPTAIIIGITHVIWHKYLDKKEGWVPSDHIGDEMVMEAGIEKPKGNIPKIYAILPFLPMVFALLFSQHGIPGIKLRIETVVLLSFIIGLLFEAVRHRGNFDVLADGLKCFLQAMAKSMSGIVALVIAAGVFAEGFKAIGLLNMMIELVTSMGIGGVMMSIILVLITTFVAIITGSNGASFYPLLELIPNIAAKLGVPKVMLILPMHQASTIARPLSPVAGVMVAIAGILKMNPFELVKRCSVPSIVGLVAHHILAFWLSV